MSEVVIRYKSMIQSLKIEDFTYETGMRPTAMFLNSGPQPITYEFDLPFISYGDRATKTASR
eukprot:scaffold111390_cov26-Attheya_sp.AAC.1